MNAQISKDGNDKFCLCNSPSRNGEHLEKFSLVYLNTKFQKTKGKLLIYIYPNESNAQLDDVYMKKKWINSTLNYEADECIPTKSKAKRRVPRESIVVWEKRQYEKKHHYLMKETQ